MAVDPRSDLHPFLILWKWFHASGGRKETHSPLTSLLVLSLLVLSDEKVLVQLIFNINGPWMLVHRTRKLGEVLRRIK